MVHVRHFLEHSDNIMEKITVVVSERQNKNNGQSVYDNRCTKEELDKIMATYSNLFQVMDVLFALLRIPAPTTYDIINAKKQWSG